ncbi:MAG: biopolymer transporter ExbD [Phycisphaeraceae bacterium]|nr:biopolymer transporter ExbD [Phycisphaeraceae bacterium]
MAQSQVHRRGPTSPQMNMTPLIDVTFQLIIFFMLVNNIISQDAVRMVIPKLDDANIRAIPEDNTIYVNLVLADPGEAERRAEGDYLNISGRISSIQLGPLERIPKHELARLTRSLRAMREANPRIRVLVRADAGMLFSEAVPVLGAIAEAEIQTVNLVAYRDRQTQR